MAWDLTMLLVHAAALFALGAIYKHCPDRIQRAVIWILAFSNIVFLAANAAALSGNPLHWQITRLAHELEHNAMLLYVFRIFITDQERRCLQTPSLPSRSSLG